MPLPLEHITVLDLTRMLPGPYCSMILADLGANVIRVENPRYPYANPPPFFQKGRFRESAFNSILMRNKKSISLNMKKDKAREIFYELVKQADVVLDTFRPKVMEKLKIDYTTLSTINPHIICCSLTGYGQHGPYEQVAGHDLNYISICGILDLNRDRKIFGKEHQERKPIVPGVQAADIGGALVTAIGILAAIIERDQNPDRKGQYIDISMTDCVFSFMPMTAAYYISENLNTGIKTENPLHGAMPYYTVYKTKDNKYLSVGAIELDFWNQLCEGIGREDLKLKQTVTREKREQLFNEVQNEFLKKTQAEWMEIFKNYDTCLIPVKNFAEACEDPQIKAREMVVKLNHPKLGEVQNIGSPIKLSRTPLSIRSLAPKTGQHNKEILESLKFSPEEIKELKKEGVI
jgi:crotonobetainyl-CoA:carnitine CoA-transferase CaiB-like acyl-CoA transferase